RAAARDLALNIEARLTTNDKINNPLKQNAYYSVNSPPTDIITRSFIFNGLSCSRDYIYFTASDNLAANGYVTLKLNNSSRGLMVELSCALVPALQNYY
ncbi:MAG TPA: hypothetical protein VFH39_03280, partial [Candidatus Saccharimonadales bacterium]|nr:hypothetical protein [Candidatus Saccharimonadales bacterium]